MEQESWGVLLIILLISLIKATLKLYELTPGPSLGQRSAELTPKPGEKRGDYVIRSGSRILGAGFFLKLQTTDDHEEQSVPPFLQKPAFNLIT